MFFRQERKRHRVVILKRRLQWWKNSALGWQWRTERDEKKVERLDKLVGLVLTAPVGPHAPAPQAAA
eukprot:12921452-Prorocentrum_lima.AAC.1